MVPAVNLPTVLYTLIGSFCPDDQPLHALSQTSKAAHNGTRQFLQDRRLALPGKCMADISVFLERVGFFNPNHATMLSMYGRQFETFSINSPLLWNRIKDLIYKHSLQASHDIYFYDRWQTTIVDRHVSHGLVLRGDRKFNWSIACSQQLFETARVMAQREGGGCYQAVLPDIIFELLKANECDRAAEWINDINPQIRGTLQHLLRATVGNAELTQRFATAVIAQVEREDARPELALFIAAEGASLFPDEVRSQLLSNCLEQPRFSRLPDELVLEIISGIPCENIRSPLLTDFLFLGENKICRIIYSMFDPRSQSRAATHVAQALFSNGDVELAYCVIEEMRDTEQQPQILSSIGMPEGALLTIDSSYQLAQTVFKLSNKFECSIQEALNHVQITSEPDRSQVMVAIVGQRIKISRREDLDKAIPIALEIAHPDLRSRALSNVVQALIKQDRFDEAAGLIPSIPNPIFQALAAKDLTAESS